MICIWFSGRNWASRTTRKKRSSRDTCMLMSLLWECLKYCYCVPGVLILDFTKLDEIQQRDFGDPQIPSIYMKRIMFMSIFLRQCIFLQVLKNLTTQIKIRALTIDKSENKHSSYSLKKLSTMKKSKVLFPLFKKFSFSTF